MKLSQMQIAARTELVARIHKFKVVGQRPRWRGFPGSVWTSREARHG